MWPSFSRPWNATPRSVTRHATVRSKSSFWRVSAALAAIRSASRTSAARHASTVAIPPPTVVCRPARYLTGARVAR